MCLFGVVVVFTYALMYMCIYLLGFKAKWVVCPWVSCVARFTTQLWVKYLLLPIDEAILERGAWQLGDRRAILKRPILTEVNSSLGLIVHNYFSFVFLHFLFLAPNSSVYKNDSALFGNEPVPRLWVHPTQSCSTLSSITAHFVAHLMFVKFGNILGHIGR